MRKKNLLSYPKKKEVIYTEIIRCTAMINIFVHFRIFVGFKSRWCNCTETAKGL